MLQGGGGLGGGTVWWRGGGQQGEASYPSQSLLHCDHLLLHHHHELDSLLVAHGDLAGDVADVLSCQEGKQQWQSVKVESQVDH